MLLPSPQEVDCQGRRASPAKCRLLMARLPSLQVELAFPDKDEARLLVACSNGKAYSLDALEMLDEAGYTNLVGLRGGYYAWNRY